MKHLLLVLVVCGLIIAVCYGQPSQQTTVVKSKSHVTKRSSSSLLKVNKKKKKKKNGGSKSMSMTEIEFPYSLQEALDEHLMTTHIAFTTPTSDSVILDCESDVSFTILRKFPMSIFHWSFNSRHFIPDENRMSFNGGKLEITQTQTTDSGVYVCKIEFTPNRMKTVGFFSVAVDSGKVDVLLDSRKSTKRKCPSAVFGLLYTKASRVWKLNGKLFKGMEKTSARNLTSDLFYPLTTNMTGKWTCVVGDGMTDRSWTVASFNLKVVPPPPFKAQAREFAEKYPVLSILIILTPTLFVIFVGFLVGYRATADKKYQKLGAVQGVESKEDQSILQEAIAASEQSDINVNKT